MSLPAKCDAFLVLQCQNSKNIKFPSKWLNAERQILKWRFNENQPVRRYSFPFLSSKSLFVLLDVASRSSQTRPSNEPQRNVPPATGFRFLRQTQNDFRPRERPRSRRLRPAASQGQHRRPFGSGLGNVDPKRGGRRSPGQGFQERQKDEGTENMPHRRTQNQHELNKIHLECNTIW